MAEYRTPEFHPAFEEYCEAIFELREDAVDVEEIDCTSVAGGQIIFADLTAPEPAFVEVSLDQVKKLNPTVGKIVR